MFYFFLNAGSVMLFLLFIGVVAATPLTEIREDMGFQDYSSNLDDPMYRLTDIVQPLYVTVDLDVFLSESRFNGIVQIEVDVSI